MTSPISSAQDVSPRTRVLLVEDDPDLRDALSHILDSAEMDVKAAADGAEALAFLDAEPLAFDAVVTTTSGTYTNAVQVDYLIDMGISTLTDENGSLLGTLHGEITGHVSYVPGVGPVEMWEEHEPYVWVDFGPNEVPDEIARWLGVVVETQSLSLAADPVAVTGASWGEVKAMYR